MVDILPLQITAIVACTAVAVSVLRMVTRLIEARSRPSVEVGADPRVLVLLQELRERLDRVERIVDTTAAEVERVAEADRFVAKLIAERTPTLMPTPHVERVNTPH